MTDLTLPPIEALPPPLTPPDCDISDFPRMMIDINRMRSSSFDAMPDSEAWRAGLNLWFSAWHQVPAASLPANDPELCKFSGLGRDVRTWASVRDAAMHGWVLCSDGLYYHATVAEFALESWLEKLAQRISSGAGNARRYRHVFDPVPIYARMEEAMALLEALNPQSRVISRNRRRLAGRTPDDLPVGDENGSTNLPPGGDNPPGGNADGSATGKKRPPTGNPGGVPSRSQETGTETGTGNLKKDASASIVDTVDEAGWFAALWAAYPHVRGRSSKPKSRAAFAAVPLAEQPLLAEAAQRYRIGGTLPTNGPPSLARWIDEELYRDWLPVDGADHAGLPDEPWTGPAKVRDQILAHLTPKKGGKDQAMAWVRRWLDISTTWSDVPPSIVCRSETVEIKIREGLGEWLRSNGIALVRLASEVAA
jgi:hypothetical protein